MEEMILKCPTPHIWSNHQPPHERAPPYWRYTLCEQRQS